MERGHERQRERVSECESDGETDKKTDRQTQGDATITQTDRTEKKTQTIWKAVFGFTSMEVSFGGG